MACEVDHMFVGTTVRLPSVTATERLGRLGNRSPDMIMIILTVALLIMASLATLTAWCRLARRDRTREISPDQTRPAPWPLRALLSVVSRAQAARNDLVWPAAPWGIPAPRQAQPRPAQATAVHRSTPQHTPAGGGAVQATAGERGAARPATGERGHARACAGERRAVR
jgi:hypothetical protein